jgi:hypothetical protein
MAAMLSRDGVDQAERTSGECALVAGFGARAREVPRVPRSVVLPVAVLRAGDLKPNV